jgi:hypothetical protein
MKDEQPDNQLDKIFRNALQSSHNRPSTGLWQKIESRLDAEDRQFYTKRKRRRMLLTAVILLMISGLGVIYTRTLNTAITLAEKPEPTRQPIVVGKKIQGVAYISQLNHPAFVRKTESHNNNSLTRPEALQLKNFAAKKENTFSEETEQVMNLINIQHPESSIDIIQAIAMESIPLPISSQMLLVNTERNRLLNKLSVTTFFSQEFAGYNLSDNDATAADGREIEKRERNAFSASMGFYLNYQITPKWVIQTGLSYSWSSSNIDSAKSYAVKDNSGNVQYKMNTISGYGYLKYPAAISPSVGDSVFTDKAYSRIHYLTLPILASYRIPLKRFSLLVGFGASLNLLTSATLEAKIHGANVMEQEKAVPINGIKNLYFGIIMKADLEYHINNNVGVNIIPSFKNSLSPINMHSALSAYPYNFGIGAGISYHF